MFIKKLLETAFIGSIIFSDFIYAGDKKLDYGNLDYIKVKEIISDPDEAFEYKFSHLTYELNSTIDSFKKTHETTKGQCGDFAVAYAALLEDDNYEPIILALEGNQSNGDYVYHWVYKYEKDGLIGCIGSNFEDTLTPDYRSIDELVIEINKKAGFHKFKNWGILDLRSLKINYLDGNSPIPYKVKMQNQVPVLR